MSNSICITCVSVPSLGVEITWDAFPVDVQGLATRAEDRLGVCDTMM